MVHAERAALINDLADLSDEQWSTQSLCGEWTVHDVAAHLIDNAQTTTRRLVVAMIRARFDFDRQNAQGVERERRTSASAMLIQLRRVATCTSTAGCSRKSSTAKTSADLSGSNVPILRRLSPALWRTRHVPRYGWVVPSSESPGSGCELLTPTCQLARAPKSAVQHCRCSCRSRDARQRERTFTVLECRGWADSLRR